MTGRPLNFDPGLLQMRWAWEKSPGSQTIVKGDGTTPGNWHDYRPSGEKLGLNRALVERTVISKSKMRARPMPGKLLASGEVDRDGFDARQDALLAMLLFGACDNPVNVGGEAGAYVHRFHGGASDIVFPQSVTWEIDRNDGLIQRLHDCRLGNLSLTLPNSGLIQVKPTWVVGTVDYWGPMELQVGGTSTAAPEIYGLSDAAYLDEPVFVKVISSTSSTVVVKVKRGTPTSYGTATQTFTKGKRQWVMDETGSPIGDRSIPVELMFPATGTYVATDEWKCPPLIDSWDPTYVDTMTSNEIFGFVNRDQLTEIEVTNATAAIVNPAANVNGYGKAFPRRTRTRGERMATVTINREYQAVNFKEQLEMLGVFRMDLGLHSGVTIGTSGLYDGALDIVMPSVTISGKSPSAETKDKMDEQVSLQPFSPSLDGALPDDFYFYLYNDVPDLTVF